MFEGGLILKVEEEFFNQSGSSKKFELIKKGDNKATIIYGRNGAGKTTLSNLIYNKITNNDINNIDLLTSDSRSIESNYFDKIHIFNEKFIDENVKFKEDGLRTIVLLGENIDVDNQIESCNVKINQLEKDIFDIGIEKYEDKNNINNPKNVYDEITTLLRSDNNWASRRQRIEKITRKSNVTDDVVNNIMKTGSRQITILDFEEKLEEYEKTSENKEVIDFKFNDFKINGEDIREYTDIITTVITKKSADELSKNIYNVLKKEGIEKIEKINETMNSDSNLCPYCFQELKEEYKNIIINKISETISKDENDFIQKLDNLYIKKIDNVQMPNIISDNEELLFQRNLEKLNYSIDIYNENIDIKKKNMYESIDLIPINILEAYENYNKVVSNIILKIDRHNKNVNEIKKIKEELTEMNNALAYAAIEKKYKLYKKLEDKKNNDILKCEEKKEEIEKIRNEIEILYLKKSNHNIAIDEINKSLSLIFLTKERIQVCLDNKDNYTVKSRGKEIVLDKLSTGERNVIALCYFFASTLNMKKHNEKYVEDCLVVIDDPISSFDHENKIGVYSFLKSKINEIHLGNKSSRFIFFTHNYDVAYNLHKIARKNLKKITSLRLENFILYEDDYHRGKNQYNMLINNIYKYAKRDECCELNSLTIGNSIRRVLEMFSSFVFQKDIDSLIPIINDELKSKNSSDNTNLLNYINNYVLTILINCESHTEYLAKSFDENFLYEQFDDEEKIKASKICLIILYLLYEKHLTNSIGDKATKDVVKWINELNN